MVGIALEVTGAILVTDDAAQRVVRDEEVNGVTAQPGEHVALRVDDHVVGTPHATTGLRDGLPLDLDQTQTAAPRRGQLGVVTQAWDIDAVRQGRFEDGGPRRDLHRLAINRQGDHTGLPSATVAVCCVLSGNVPVLPGAAALLRPPSMRQTPAGQRWSTIWARYSSLK